MIDLKLDTLHKKPKVYNNAEERSNNEPTNQ